MKTANYDIKRIIKHGNQLLMVISFNQQDIAKLTYFTDRNNDCSNNYVNSWNGIPYF